MRCYFLRNNQIVAVEDLLGLTDDEAVEKSHSLFAQRKHSDAFEVWDMARVVLRYPDPDLPVESVKLAG